MDEDLGRHRRGCGQLAEIRGAASGPAGIPGSPAACATLWGPVGAGERIDCQTITLPVRRRDTLMVEPLNLASGGTGRRGSGRPQWPATKESPEAAGFSFVASQ